MHIMLLEGLDEVVKKELNLVLLWNVMYIGHKA